MIIRNINLILTVFEECCWDGFDCPVPTSAPTVSVRAPSSSFVCVVSASCIEKITNDPKKEIDWLGDGFCDDWIDGFNTYGAFLFYHVQ